MAFEQTIDITNYVNRAVEILKADGRLINPNNTSSSLVTDILAQEPPIEQSPNKAIIPIIYVYPSKNFISRVENIGRDSLDFAGAKYYHLELYNVIVARGIDRQAAQVKCQEIGHHVRESFQHNLRLGKLPFPATDPIAAMNETIAVPFVLNSTNPNIQAINVILRIQVPIIIADIPPTITLIGPNPQNVDFDNPYVEFGATCHDMRDGDITGDIVIVVDPNIIALNPGTFFVTYNCMDSAGNAAPEVKRTVNVS